MGKLARLFAGKVARNTSNSTRESVKPFSEQRKNRILDECSGVRRLEWELTFINEKRVDP
jgi:hypothetical protein